MSDSKTLVVRSALETIHGAGTLFRMMLRGGEEGDSVKALVRTHPALAIEALGHSNEALGLTPRGSADVLEGVLGAVDNDTTAIDLLEQHMTAKRAGELLAARGDLPSIASEVAPVGHVVRAIRAEAGIKELDPLFSVNRMTSLVDDEEEDYDDLDDEEPVADGSPDDDSDPVEYASVGSADIMRVCAVCRCWAFKLKDRSDYGAILNTLLADKRRFREFLLLALWFEASSPADVGSVPIDLFDQVGLDPHDGRADLAKVLAGEALGALDLDQGDWTIVSASVARERTERAKAPTIADQVRARAEADIDNLDF